MLKYTINCVGGRTKGKMHIWSDCLHTHRSLRKVKTKQTLLTATQEENWSASELELGDHVSWNTLI